MGPDRPRSLVVGRPGSAYAGRTLLPELERIRVFALLVGIAILGRGGVAAAQPAPADAAFERGREALQVGKYTQACAAFEESQRLEPRPATQFNIALCSEQLGRLATALVIHRELAQTEDNPQRRARSAELAAQLESRVPRLRIDVGVLGTRTKKQPVGTVVTINTVRATSFKDLPINLGTSRVVATAPGYLEWTGQVTADTEGERTALTIQLERDPDAELPDPDPGEPAEDATEPEAPADDRRPRSVGTSHRKTYAVIAMIGGGLAVGGGIAFGISASNRWADAKNACGGDQICSGSTELVNGRHHEDQARLRGNLSTISFVAGGAAILGGVLLWVTAPSESSTVAIAPSVDASSAGLTVVGRF